jgi:hypothetical protein
MIIFHCRKPKQRNLCKYKYITLGQEKLNNHPSLSYEGIHEIQKFTLTPLEQKEKGTLMIIPRYNSNTLNNSKSQSCSGSFHFLGWYDNT